MATTLTCRCGAALTRVVDHHGFPKHGRAVSGVGQLGVQVEPEVGVVVHLLVSQDDELPALGGGDVLLQDVVNHGVDVLIHIVEQEGGPVLYGHLQLLEEVGVIEGSDLEGDEAGVQGQPTCRTKGENTLEVETRCVRTLKGARREEEQGETPRRVNHINPEIQEVQVESLVQKA